jgi:hypothetical protein
MNDALAKCIIKSPATLENCLKHIAERQERVGFGTPHEVAS